MLKLSTAFLNSIQPTRKYDRKSEMLFTMAKKNNNNTQESIRQKCGRHT